MLRQLRVTNIVDSSPSTFAEQYHHITHTQTSSTQILCIHLIPEGADVETLMGPTSGDTPEVAVSHWLLAVFVFVAFFFVSLVFTVTIISSKNVLAQLANVLRCSWLY